MPRPKHLALRREIVETCRAMNASGLNQGMSGNVSARIKGGCLITPSGVPYETMTPDMVVEMDLDGGYRGALNPSSEWRLHRDIYAARLEAGAVIHAHAVHATALSCLRIEVPAFHYMIAVTGGASLRCADYATFGTAELSAAMLRALEGRNSCLLANHGMIGFGPNLAKTLRLVGEIETLCRQYWIARQIGEPVILDEAEMARVLERFRDYGQQPARRRAPSKPGRRSGSAGPG